MTRFKLLTPLSYLRLKNPDLIRYQWIYPLLLSVLSLYAYTILPSRPRLFGDDSIVHHINSLLVTLIGFYIAALAAVASFPNRFLDNPMKGKQTTLSSNRGGETNPEVLTRRRFLTILFGYCAYVSMFLFLAGFVSGLLLPSLPGIPALTPWLDILRYVWLTAYLFLCTSLFITTLLGLHYLTERMHRE